MTDSVFKMDETLETVFEREKEKWRSKMIKVFGDLHPYHFYITYGHSDGRHLGRTDADILEMEKAKSAPFERLNDMHEVDKQAEEEFHQILSGIENQVVTSSLHEFLQERKKECAIVLAQFDKIIELCEEYFRLEYADCRKRVQDQIAMQKPILSEVERYLSEVEEAGDREISLLKDNIGNYLREVGLTWSNQIEALYDTMNAQPPVMETWSKCAETITSKEVRSSFLMRQQDTARLWKKAFDDLLMLSDDLERYRCNYNMAKSNLERAIYWMNRNYRDNMPELTKVQRQISVFVDRRSQLYRELMDLEGEIKRERCLQTNIKLKCYNKIAGMRLSNKIAKARTLSNHKKVFETKKIEVLDLLKDILKGDEYIHGEILQQPWNTIELSQLKVDIFTKNAETKSEHFQENIKGIKTLHEDEFADAFRALVSNGQFENLLNYIAEELGYMLDFHWVDYVKKTLQIQNEVRWMELFKVFKVNFKRDIKDLKEHMMKFSKISNDEIVFDLNQALDGFLQFVWLKRQPFDSLNGTEEDETRTFQEVWDTIDGFIPKSLLWDSVLELLDKYQELLQSRQRLLTLRSDVVMENEELNTYLGNCYSHNVPRKTSS